jgi:outer membrane immunogenic protein
MKDHRSRISALALASAAACLGSSPSRAGDLFDRGTSLKDVEPVQTWAGFYIGANGGYAFNANNNKNIVAFDPHFGIAETVQRSEPAGGFGGAQAGYNWQYNRFVFGVEADEQIADIEGNKFTFSPVAGGLDNTLHSEVEWFGTARGRLGYGFDHTLIYFTGGFAFAKARDDLNVTFAGTSVPAARLSHEDVRTGWVLGGGVEFKPTLLGVSLTPNWSAKVEYQFIDLTNDNADLRGVDFAGNHVHAGSVGEQLNTIRVGINYHFNREVEQPLK